MSQQEKTEYKYKVEVSQSLTSGIIALHGSYKFDDVEDGKNSRAILLVNLTAVENDLKNLGYKVAKDIETKEKNNNGTKVGNYTTATKIEEKKK